MAVVLGAAIMTGCGPSGSGGGGPFDRSRLVVTGSSTVAPLVGEIARRFEAKYPGVRVDVQTGGSSRGIADVRQGTADIGMVSRALTPQEGDLAAFTIALDGIAPIVHQDNPVPSLTDAQIVGIFTGTIRRWSEVGGPDAAITVVNKAEGRSTLELFLTYFRLEREAIRADVVIGDNQHGILTVAGDPHAIGYVSIGTAESEAARGVAIRMLPMGGVAPSLAAVRDGTFPLARPLNLVTRGARPDLADAFLAFAASDGVTDLVEAEFFVPLAE
jgi:phosphate transport system substrate-binding protein